MFAPERRGSRSGRSSCPAGSPTRVAVAPVLLIQVRLGDLLQRGDHRVLVERDPHVAEPVIGRVTAEEDECAARRLTVLQRGQLGGCLGGALELVRHVESVLDEALAVPGVGLSDGAALGLRPCDRRLAAIESLRAEAGPLRWRHDAVRTALLAVPAWAPRVPGEANAVPPSTRPFVTTADRPQPLLLGLGLRRAGRAGRGGPTGERARPEDERRHQHDHHHHTRGPEHPCRLPAEPD